MRVFHDKRLGYNGQGRGLPLKLRKICDVRHFYDLHVGLPIHDPSIPVDSRSTCRSTDRRMRNALKRRFLVLGHWYPSFNAKMGCNAAMRLIFLHAPHDWRPLSLAHPLSPPRHECYCRNSANKPGGAGQWFSGNQCLVAREICRLCVGLCWESPDAAHGG